MTELLILAPPGAEEPETVNLATGQWADQPPVVQGAVVGWPGAVSVSWLVPDRSHDWPTVLDAVDRLKAEPYVLTADPFSTFVRLDLPGADGDSCITAQYLPRLGVTIHQVRAWIDQTIVLVLVGQVAPSADVRLVPAAALDGANLH
jgi:hypothetical protein